MNIINAFDLLLEKYSQLEVSEITGIAQPHISKIRSGKRQAGLDTYIKVAKVLEVHIEDLLDGYHDYEKFKIDILRRNIKKVMNGRDKGTFITDINLKNGKTKEDGLSDTDIDYIFSGVEVYDYLKEIADAEGITVEDLYNPLFIVESSSELKHLSRKVKDFISKKENLPVLEKMVEMLEAHKKILGV
jgi:transcriptional regulator with XRE-family HTH domain